MIMNIEYLNNVSTTRMGSKVLRSLLCVVFVICTAAKVRLCFSSSLLTFPPFLLKFLRESWFNNEKGNSSRNYKGWRATAGAKTSALMKHSANSIFGEKNP